MLFLLVFIIDKHVCDMRDWFRSLWSMMAVEVGGSDINYVT